MSNNKTKTVVTGGVGFIGSHLVNRLLKENREAIIVSDFSKMGVENLAELGIKTSEVKILRTDLSEYQQAIKAVQGADVVFHLAATVGNLEFLHAAGMAELNALQDNLVIDANILRACLKNGVKKLIYASSCAVYPMNKQFVPGAVFAESSLDVKEHSYLGPNTSGAGLGVIDPDGGYGWSKLLGEIELQWMKNINIGIARIFNIYGPNEPLGSKAHVVGDLISRVIRHQGGDFTVYGNGKQTRDFLYVADCVDALLKLADHASSPPITVNLGSGQATEIGTLAQKIINISGKNINIVYDAAKPIGPRSRTADVSYSRKALDWQSKVNLDEGLTRTYEWVERKLKRS